MKLRDGLARDSQNHVSRTMNNRTTISIAVTIRYGQIDIVSCPARRVRKIARPDLGAATKGPGKAFLIYTKFDKPHNQPFTNICTVPKFAVGAPAAPLGIAGWHRLEQRCRGLDLRQRMSAAERRYTKSC
jgi:hypothetical protein